MTTIFANLQAVRERISRAAQQANITRAAIRQPLGSNARVTIAVVDAVGVVLGIFRQQDAPVFGFDVAVQKARTAAFFSSTNAAAQLRSAGFGSYVDRAAAVRVAEVSCLNGRLPSVDFSPLIGLGLACYAPKLCHLLVDGGIL